MEVCRVGGTPPASHGKGFQVYYRPPVSGGQKYYLLPRSTRHFIHTYQHVIKNTDVRSMFSDEESLGAK